MIDDRPYHHGNLRAALLEAAERGLRERGADQLALRDLAREIGVSHAAPRRHFPTRQALLDALAEDGFTRLHTALREAAGSDDTVTRLRAVMTAYIRFACDNAALVELMYGSKHQPGATRIDQAADGAFGLMKDLVVRGQAEGVLRGDDPDRLGLVLLATLHGIALIGTSPVGDADLVDGLVDTALEQFVPRV
ncbi:TetR/AcrR family transcriptional regulator [Lentzea sp. NPDC060358]|uniref:TetR/AcrR family transcriptional regulator n=1 Tax=Lentzea sp. NPDC060358 TaxID=3347103 RepID=UPI0036674186